MKCKTWQWTIPDFQVNLFLPLQHWVATGETLFESPFSIELNQVTMRLIVGWQVVRSEAMATGFVLLQPDGGCEFDAG